MTGIPLGVPAPPSPTLAPAQRLSRTRRPHGFIAMGNATAAVHSTRHRDHALGVTVTVGTDALTLTGAMTPTQARNMAKALTSAADAAERQQQGGVR